MALKAGYKGIKGNLLRKIMDEFLKIDGIIPSSASADNPLATQSEINDIRSEQSVLGAKNLNGTPYRNNTSQGITYTVNPDGTISVSGTSVAQTEISHDSFVAPFSAQVLLSGGIDSTMHIYPWDVTDGGRPYTDSSKTTKQTNNAGLLEISFWMEKGHSYSMIPRVNANVAISETKVFKPMLRLATDPDNTYVPYAMTNKQLTDAVNEASTGWDYSTTLTDTGKKWVDGKTIKAIVLDFHASPVTVKYDTWGSVLDNAHTALGVTPETIISCTSIGSSKGCTPCIAYYDSTNDKINALTPRNGANADAFYLILEFTEAVVTAKAKRTTKKSVKTEE